jgi:flagellar biosynthesis/type III secretory pathway M-ring protein FliF/YscJ
VCSSDLGGGATANQDTGEEEQQDSLSMISGIRGPSKPNSIKKINEVIAGSPEEALQIIRSWMYGGEAA